ncbi:MAG: hypothetical protein MSS98_05675 [Alphaproteobacteria bacterium]|nr:hypothetical protein [Alphaproteobacteria bacterium]
MLNTICKFFKYPSPAGKPAPSPARGEGYGLPRPWCHKILGTGLVSCGRGANSFGRSMIEMLGVLAIIGVLSVGGIAGYSKAMTKYKVNKTTDEYSFMITELLTYRDNLTKNSDERPIYLAQIVKDLNFVPQTWQIYSNVHITDTLGNRVAPYISTEDNFVIDVNIFSNDKKSSDYSKELCVSLIRDVAQNMYSSIKTISPQNTSLTFLRRKNCSSFYHRMSKSERQYI